ncbi:MAG: sensor histidine kinase, partial [Spirochaetota bacterium]
LTVIPENELFAAQRRAFLIPLFAVFVFSGALFLSASRLVSSSVTQPMETLVAAMRRAQQGEFDAPISEDRRDEFGYLYQRYNAMVERISQLIRELYQERLLKQEMELQYLQNQVNPHFLYNTLDTINWLAKKHGAADISRIVMALTQLYRTAFNKGRDYVRVGDLLAGVRSYLYIEQFRYGWVREYRFQVDDRVLDCAILNLVLQPLVENAVVHGVGDVESGGDVTIRADYAYPELRFAVTDTGCGMSAEKLAIIRRSISSNGSSESSGLRNVNRRLQLSYGEGYGLCITSEIGTGTTVSFSVPVRRMPE